MFARPSRRLTLLFTRLTPDLARCLLQVAGVARTASQLLRRGANVYVQWVSQKGKEEKKKIQLPFKKFTVSFESLSKYFSHSWLLEEH